MVYMRRAQPRHRTGPARRLLALAGAIMMLSAGQHLSADTATDSPAYANDTTPVVTTAPARDA